MCCAAHSMRPCGTYLWQRRPSGHTSLQMQLQHELQAHLWLTPRPPVVPSLGTSRVQMALMMNAAVMTRGAVRLTWAAAIAVTAARTVRTTAEVLLVQYVACACGWLLRLCSCNFVALRPPMPFDIHALSGLPAATRGRGVHEPSSLSCQSMRLTTLGMAQGIIANDADAVQCMTVALWGSKGWHCSSCRQHRLEGRQAQLHGSFSLRDLTTKLSYHLRCHGSCRRC